MTLTRELVSVAICLYNGRRFIARALDSVFAQDYQHVEVILVDDGSTDGGADFVESRFRDARLRIIRQENRGLGFARVAALEPASGSLIAFLDQDDEWLSDKLSQQVELLRARPDAGLVFTDCEYIDQYGSSIGFASDRFQHATIDWQGPKGMRALLTRGCFIDISSVLARRDVIDASGGFAPRWRYVEDYDLWLRIARSHPIEYLAAPLTRRRWHADQVTARWHELALREESALLRPFLTRRSYPPDVRRAIRHYLFGQHTSRAQALIGQRRYGAAARALIGACRYPDALAAVLAAGVRWSLGAARPPVSPAASEIAPVADVWLDGSDLGAGRTGSFNLIAELTRTLIDAGCAVHLKSTTAAGRAALRQRLGSRAGQVRGGRFSRLLSIMTRSTRTLDLIMWKARFDVPGARRVALVMDLTPRLYPGLHTTKTIEEFERYLGYAVTHADEIVTISQQSRTDILKMLPVFPEKVGVIPVPMNPVYADPTPSAIALDTYGLARPFILSVGTREPRKNLRRLVDAFHAVHACDELRHHDLVLVGPPGWDKGFEAWLSAHPAAPRVRLLGFVDDAQLASLYHCAEAVVYCSLYEGFGLPVLEAMSCSAFVLTSRVGALMEVLGPDGRYFDPMSEPEISGALLASARVSPGEAREYRDYCRRRADAMRLAASRLPPLPGLSPPFGPFA
jgi:glycosyltransferase involved in cell wall biosynthesis